ACRGSAVSQELLKEGFHRELLVKVELGGTGQWTEGCTVAARTRLPPGVYVDPYELASLQEHNVTKVRRSWLQCRLLELLVLISSILNGDYPVFPLPRCVSLDCAHVIRNNAKTIHRHTCWGSILSRTLL
uniref:Phosphatidylinositol-glycan biosynthesis class X protein n=1 Tax=Pavo cristatus TaxID=9049 RepID=A0A8C9ER92_PAVCR